MNARMTTTVVSATVAVILSMALIFSIGAPLQLQHASAIGNSTDGYNKTNNNNSTTTTASGASTLSHLPSLAGQIASVQPSLENGGAKPGWIQSGIWVLRSIPSTSSNATQANEQFIAKFEMVKPDGTAAHMHSITNFKATQMTQDANSTAVIITGTATVTMKDGPVSDVPLTIKIFNNNVIGLWIGPEKVNAHFGSNSPVYGTVSAYSKTLTKTAGSGEGKNESSEAAKPEENDKVPTSNNTASTAPTTTTSAQTNSSPFKLIAKEVDEIYHWATNDGVNNPTLTMTANAQNVVQISNPTDQKHEFVIESSGKEVATSGDIAPNGTGQLSFQPTAAGTYEYHCEYHPTTMKGTIQVK